MKATLTALVLIVVSTAAFGQIVQIPTVQSCNIGKSSATATVYLSKRDSLSTAGTIDINAVDLGCDPNGDGYPTGDISMRFSLTDSSISDLRVTLIEQMTTVGKHTTTTYLNGRCSANSGTVPCRFWLTLADNKPANLSGTADVLGVFVIDAKGNTLTYGTGPVITGDITVTQF